MAQSTLAKMASPRAFSLHLLSLILSVLFISVTSAHPQKHHHRENLEPKSYLVPEKTNLFCKNAQIS